MDGSCSSEQEVIEYLESLGCEVRTRGWPDLLVKNAKGRVFGLELKSKKDKVTMSQIDMQNALHNWTPLRTLVRRYSDVSDLAEDNRVGLPATGDHRNGSYQIGFDDGYDAGFAKGYQEARERFVGRTARMHVTNE